MHSNIAADAFGFSEIVSGSDGESIDFNDEFMRLNSQLQTGKISLDILLRKDTQPKIAKVEVPMEDYIQGLQSNEKTTNQLCQKIFRHRCMNIISCTIFYHYL